MVEIIPFTSTLTDSCDDRVSSVFARDIMDELLHDHSLSYTRSSEETYFSSFQHRTDKIHDLDPRLKEFRLRRELFELW